MQTNRVFYHAFLRYLFALSRTILLKNLCTAFIRYLFALSRTILLKNLCTVKNVPSNVFMYIKMIKYSE